MATSAPTTLPSSSPFAAATSTFNPAEVVFLFGRAVPADCLQSHDLAVHEVQLRVWERLVNVTELVRVDVQVVVGDDTGDELAVKIVVRDVDGADTPVRVGVAVCARTKGTVWKKCSW